MKFGLRIPPSAAPDVVAQTVLEAETAGFEYAWIPDSQLLWRDVWVTLGAAAAQTSQIVLGTNVTNPKTRDVTVTASAAASVEQMIPQRFVLGLGTGDSSVKVMGQRPARIAEMRDFIQEFRTLVDGGEIPRGGKHVRMIGASGGTVPVYISATGPKMLQFAGEVGDGVITLAGIADDSIDYMLSNIEAGARRSGRGVGEVDIVTGLFCYIADDWKAARRLAQPYAAVYAMRYKDSIADFGVSPKELSEAQHDVYPDLAHAEDWERAMDLTDWVPDELLEMFCDKYCLMGTSDDVTQKVLRLKRLGVTSLYVRGFYSYKMPADVLQTFSTTVIPSLRRS